LTQFSNARQERERIENAELEERLELERPVWLAQKWIELALYALLALLPILVGGLYLLRRAITISADKRGLFPLLLGRVAGSWVIFDANRSPSAATAIGDDSPRITHVLEPGQAQATSQAQAIQLAAALSAGDQTQGRRQEIAGALMGASQRVLARPMPRVERAGWEQGHVEQLLVENGQLEGGGYG
jgi:hypothetical protein